MKRLSILILTRNRLPLLRRLLTAPTLRDGLDWWLALDERHLGGVCVLDQASTDGTSEYLADTYPPLPLGIATRGQIEQRRVAQNLGCAGGRNYLLDRLTMPAREDIIVFLDDDIVPISGAWLERLVKPILADEADISGVEGRCVDRHGLTHATDGQSDYVSGGWMAVSNRLFADGLRFDERFNPNYYEDVDFCLRAAQTGARLVAVGDVGLLHTPEPGSSVNAVGDASRAKFVQKWSAWLRERDR